jgi:hypothetical protein
MLAVGTVLCHQLSISFGVARAATHHGAWTPSQNGVDDRGGPLADERLRLVPAGRELTTETLIEERQSVEAGSYLDSCRLWG